MISFLTEHITHVQNSQSWKKTLKDSKIFRIELDDERKTTKIYKLRGEFQRESIILILLSPSGKYDWMIR